MCKRNYVHAPPTQKEVGAKNKEGDRKNHRPNSFMTDKKMPKGHKCMPSLETGRAPAGFQDSLGNIP